MHPEVVVGKNGWRSVDIVESELDSRHHTLTNGCLRVTGAGGEEPGDVDVMGVVTVTVGVDLVAEVCTIGELWVREVVSPAP